MLGIQWFSLLGPLLWHFMNLIMEFTYLGKRVKLRGATKKKLRSINVDRLSKVMNHSTQEAPLS